MINWIRLINEKREQLIEAGITAYRNAWNDQHLRFIVELYEDGEISIWYNVAGGNSFTSSSHKGTSVQVCQFCHQYHEIEFTESDLEEAFKELDQQELLDDIRKELEESDGEHIDLESICINGNSSITEQSRDALEKAREEYIEWDISEYARECATQKIDDLLENYERMYDNYIAI